MELPASPSQQGRPAGCRAPCLCLPGLNQQTDFLSVRIFFAGFHWNLAGFDIGAWCLLAWQRGKLSLERFQACAFVAKGLETSQCRAAVLQGDLQPEQEGAALFLILSLRQTQVALRPLYLKRFQSLLTPLQVLVFPSFLHTPFLRHSIPLKDGTSLEAAPRPIGQHPRSDAEQLSAWQGCSTWQTDKGLRSRRKTRLGGKSRSR